MTVNGEELRIQSRLQQAWARLPVAEQARFRSMIEAAHAHLIGASAVGLAAVNNHAAHEMALVKTFLDDDPAGHAKRLSLIATGGIPVTVDEDGHILGTGKYQVFDIRWVEAFATYFEYQVLGKVDFPTVPGVVIPIPDSTIIMMAGDWGTGNWGPSDSPSTKIAALVASKSPDYTVHLGDVYYAGNQREEADNLVNIWPKGEKGTFGLNSNHEMYSGGHFYFSEAVARLFTAQSGQSYFALENNHWVIVGLDSAYFDTTPFCRAGTIGSGVQYQFLQDQVNKNKKVIILTHHNGLTDSSDGTQIKNTLLWNDIMRAFPAGKGPDFWYWGHIHNATVYRNDGSTSHTFCRCLGHGGIPAGFSQVLNKAMQSNSVTWFEGKNANDPSNMLRIMNGFTELELSGENITETFYDESGNVSWSWEH